VGGTPDVQRLTAPPGEDGVVRSTPHNSGMPKLLAAALVAVACTAIVGIQQTVALALQRTTGGVTTVITMGMVALGVWAVAVLREE
jgi:hypothetical protein